MTGGDSTTRLRSIAPYLLLALVALLPRVLDLGGFITHDEAEFWIDRSHTFLQAIQSGDYAATAITTHPGVTTMWLGSAGILLRHSLLEWGLLHELPFPTHLALMRLPAVLVHTLGVLLGYAMLRRMLPATVALLAALLWAADPFVIAYSRLLHTDALLATFATLSLLAACAHWHHGRHPALLVLSAACSALAVLSKSPGVAVLPVIAVIALWADWRAPLAALRSLAAWGGVFALTIAIAWPAVWADPGRVYELLRIGVEVEGAQPHMTGNFFLGQRQDAPGPLYYPAALALRSTPLTLLGLLLLPLAWWQARDPDYAPTRRDLLVLAAFVLLFALALSLFPKKFNRYLVPAFPALDVLAAAGLVWGAQQVARLLDVGRHAARVRWAVAGVAGVLALLNAAWWHPYSIVAFNQALGGAPAGARVFSVGWGEGYPQVADWLNQQPDITGVLTVSRMISSLNPYLREGAQAYFPREGELRDNAGYLVVYISEVQGGPPLSPSDAFYGREPPLHVAHIHGVPYAWVYQTPPPVEQQRPAVFGEHLRLRGFERSGELRRGAPLTFTLTWKALAPVPADYWLFAHLVGPEGQRRAQIDQQYQTSTWQPGRYTRTQLPLTIPADAPAGRYQLIIGMYEASSGQRVPLVSEHRADPTLSGDNALLLTELELAPPP
jgi:hypothetical protein